MLREAVPSLVRAEAGHECGGGMYVHRRAEFLSRAAQSIFPEVVVRKPRAVAQKRAVQLAHVAARNAHCSRGGRAITLAAMSARS
jgi:hypothetical protein